MTKSQKLSRQQKSVHIPYYYKPDNLSYEEWQIGLRRQFAAEQHYTIKNIGEHVIYSDFEVNSRTNNQPYKVAIRSQETNSNFCSCPDFAINTLGTCKHIEYVIYYLKKNKGLAKMFKEKYIQPYSSISLRYGKRREVIFKIGLHNREALKKLSTQYCDQDNGISEEKFDHFETFLEKAIKLDPELRCYKDALDYIVDTKDTQKRKELIERKYPEGKNSPELSSLLKSELHPYQKEAVLFAAKAGRCIIADEMGLGKTLEAIASAELMAREFGVEKVLIICPTSLKYQWKAEIEKFSQRSVFVIEGMQSQRKDQYNCPEFFKIVTYDTVKNDLATIQAMSPDLVILDEAQRIKNWKTKTAQTIKQVRSEYAIVLTGTPLENRLEELHSITEFVDRFRLGPLFRFLADHQIVDKSEKVIGYRELHDVAKTIAPILIRRNKKDVMQQLPARMDKNCYVPITPQQKEVHDEHQVAVSRLVNKWKRYKFLSEKERQMLMIHLNCMRMVSDSTYILDEKTRHDTKIAELMTLVSEIFETKGKKIVIFSQWERMTRLVARELEKRKIGYEYLHGGVPGYKRKDLLVNFHKNPESKVFLSTDAGSVGLNLQCASFLINLDCPWNPAVLEQRIARIHRFGQKEPVNVVNFISSGTIEEMILGTIKFKKSLFEGVLDNGADEVFMGENKFQQFMKGIERIVPSNQSSDGEQKPIEAMSQNDPLKSLTEDLIPTTQDRSISGLNSAPLEASFSLENIVSIGLNFLDKLTQNLGTSTSNGSDRAEKDFSQSLPFIEKDQNTGKKSIKIPLPDEATLQKAINALGAFAKVLMEKSR